MFKNQVTFKDAEKQLDSRLDKTTAMKYKDIMAAWDDETRARSFFSSRCAEASILSELHRKTQAVLDGRMSAGQARRLIREYFAGDGADALARMGFAPPEDAKGITELGSIPRIELILDTNIRMAQETAHYRKWERLKKAYPYGVWRIGVCEEHRRSHLERDGKCYSFDHPIWTQSPPGGEFNCHCTRELISEQDRIDMNLDPEPDTAKFEKSTLGFDPSKPLDDPPLPKNAPPEIEDAALRVIDEDSLRIDDERRRREIEQRMKLEEERAEEERARKEEERRAAEASRMQQDEDAKREERISVLEREAESLTEEARNNYEAEYVSDAEHGISDTESVLSRLADTGTANDVSAAASRFEAQDNEYNETLTRRVEEWKNRNAELLSTIDSVNAEIKKIYDRNPSGELSENDKKRMNMLNRQYSKLDSLRSEISYRMEQEIWRTEIVGNSATPDNILLAENMLAIAMRGRGLHKADLEKIARHQMILHGRQIAGTLCSAYRPEYQFLGKRPSVMFDKMPPPRSSGLPAGAYYMPTTETIHIENMYLKWNGMKGTAQHEFGHWLDEHSRGNIQLMASIGMDRNFVQSTIEDYESLITRSGLDIRTEMNKLIELYGNMHNYGSYWLNKGRRMFGDAFNASVSEERYAIVSYADTIQNISRAKFGFGHNVRYVLQDRSRKEAFAEAFYAFARGDREFAIDFPKTYEYIKKLNDKLKDKWSQR